MKLLKKYNFKKGGLYKEDYFNKGTYEDSVGDGLLKLDWETNR